MPPNDSLIFRVFYSQTENRACRCISFLSMLPIFRDRTADTANRTVFSNYWRPFNFAIPFFLELCDCQFLHSARAEASYAAKYLSPHKQFSQQNICLKAQNLHLAEQQLPHKSLQPLLNIRKEFIQLDC